jgi:hypothetical protein
VSAQQQRLAATLACQQDDEGKLFAQVRQQFYDLEGQLQQRRYEPGSRQSAGMTGSWAGDAQ